MEHAESCFARATPADLLRPLTLMTDRFAGVCLHNNIDGVALMLRAILNRTDLRVREVTVQKTLPNLNPLRGVRLDVYAVDDEDRPYDIEIQVGGTLEDLIRRARAYSGYLDVNQLKAGENYARLPESYVIFILDRDVLGLKQPLYRIDRYFPVAGEYHPFGDGAHIVFVNGEIRDENTPLGRLMHDLNCPDPDRMHFEVLARTVRHYKMTSEGVRKMTDVFAEFAREIERRAKVKYLAQGEEQTKRAFVSSMLANGCSQEEIVRLTSLPLDEVRALAGQGGQ